MFCVKCGNQLGEDANFCTKCGTKVQIVSKSSVSEPVPMKETNKRIVPSGKKIRIRCEKCNVVTDVMDDATCPKCNAVLPEAGYLKLYRMGSPLGVATGFGIYIDSVPTGYVGNKQTIYVRMPYGKHSVHIAVGMNRKCNDIVFDVNKESRMVASRVSMQMGVWTNSFNLQPCKPEEIPD